MRSKSKARSKKSRASQKREAIFWRPRFTWPLRAGKRANANFACSEGFFLSGVPRHMAGWPFLRGQPLLRRLLRPVFRRFSAGAPLLCSRSACRFSAAFTQTLLCLFVWPALPARRALCARSSVLFWLSVCLFRVGCTRVFSLIFYLLPFPVWLLPRKLLFICRSGRDGDFSLVLSRGFVSGLRVLSPAAFSRTFAPIACLPCSALFMRVFSLLFFALSCLTSSSQTSFHLSLRPRRASTFFRKESRQRFARGRGSAPFEPPFLRPAADLPFPPRCWPAYAALWAANRRQIRETLEKPRSRAQLFKRFCAKGDACALSPITPFFWLLAGLTALRAAIRRLARETSEKPGSKAQLFRRFCAWGMRRGFRPAGFLPATGNRN